MLACWAAGRLTVAVFGVALQAVASEDALARVRGIAFTDSVHHVQPGCVQLSDDAKAALSPGVRMIIDCVLLCFLRC
eukprot:COSAG01_NODE_12561_length_1719_cov_1.853704_1_plen_77_part_00